ncbi:hypothetical protein [Flavobacterium nackdongense]|uniref:Uncharacterized protein n=1 Tax=Flavobacterium nackdongense TaxID=2547394 RepID=A0A4V1AGH3_9FLAO|nr:hypothetical protein [Flavobacterium nackdongense]QBN18042.1 hypothetical protein E1750_04225 [Flavobacterium nackdongense]
MKKLFLLLAITFTLTCCDKDEADLLSEGIETRVSGRITDFNNSPISNVKLKVMEYKSKSRYLSLYGNFPDFIQEIEVSETNTNGEYDFTFKTSGKGNVYQIEIQPSPISEQKYSNCCHSEPITTIGNPFIFNNNQLIKLYPCDVTINLNNVSDFPFQVYHETTRNPTNNSNDIISNNQVIRRIYISKYYPQKLYINRIKSNGIKQVATYIFPASNVETLTVQSIIINETDFKNI